MVPEWMIGFGALTIAMRLVTSGAFHLLIGMEKVIESPSYSPNLMESIIICLLIIVAASYESFIENRKNTSYKSHVDSRRNKDI